MRRVLHQSSSISALPEHRFLGMAQWRSWYNVTSMSGVVQGGVIMAVGYSIYRLIDSLYKPIMMIGHATIQTISIKYRGGYPHFFIIRRLGPSIFRSPPKNIRNFKHPHKYLKFWQPRKISLILYLDLKKRP